MDYLERISSETNDDPNELSRKSLFVKFDPLVGKPTVPVSTASKTSARLAEMYDSSYILIIIISVIACCYSICVYV